VCTPCAAESDGDAEVYPRPGLELILNLAELGACVQRLPGVAPEVRLAAGLPGPAGGAGAELAAIFQRLDKDGDGVVTREELLSAGLPASEVARLMAEHDKDGDGEIDLREFRTLGEAAGWTGVADDGGGKRTGQAPAHWFAPAWYEDLPVGPLLEKATTAVVRALRQDYYPVDVADLHRLRALSSRNAALRLAASFPGKPVEIEASARIQRLYRGRAARRAYDAAQADRAAAALLIQQSARAKQARKELAQRRRGERRAAQLMADADALFGDAGAHHAASPGSEGGPSLQSPQSWGSDLDWVLDTKGLGAREAAAVKIQKLMRRQPEFNSAVAQELGQQRAVDLSMSAVRVQTAVRGMLARRVRRQKQKLYRRTAERKTLEARRARMTAVAASSPARGWDQILGRAVDTLVMAAVDGAVDAAMDHGWTALSSPKDAAGHRFLSSIAIANFDDMARPPGLGIRPDRVPGEAPTVDEAYLQLEQPTRRRRPSTTASPRDPLGSEFGSREFASEEVALDDDFVDQAALKMHARTHTHVRVRLGINPIVTLENQLLNMKGNVV
jgi:hypothetical protein